MSVGAGSVDRRDGCDGRARGLQIDDQRLAKDDADEGTTLPFERAELEGRGGLGVRQGCGAGARGHQSEHEAFHVRVLSDELSRSPDSTRESFARGGAGGVRPLPGV